MVEHDTTLVAAVVVLAAVLPACRGRRPAACADDVYVNGRIRTVDGSPGIVEAMAIREGRFLAVGGGKAVLEHRCDSTRVHDLGGRAVIPGLIDSHGHVLSLGLESTMLDLRGIRSPAEVASLVAERAKGSEEGAWILGRGWDQTLWEGGEFPDRGILDGAAPRNPVLLRRVDGHAAWVNTRALEAGGVGRDTPDPEGGRILRAEGGEPSGILLDAAADEIMTKVPKPTPGQKAEAIERAGRRCLASGLTMVHDAGVDRDTLEVLRSLAGEGKLPMRVYAMLSWDDPERDAVLSGGRVEVGGRLWLRAVKLVADGALGSRGASLLEPYADDPGNSGILVMDPGDLREAIESIVERGFQPAVHAIGDRAVRNVLDIYEDVLRERPGQDLRLRIEHAQVVALEDIPRIGRLGVIASMQPTHATSDMRWAEDRLGPVRIEGAYAGRKMMAGGAAIAAGSDFPVEPPDPLFGIHAALTREDRTGSPRGGWRPGERMTIDEALRSFTIEGARASFTEAILGSIEAGKLADFVVLEDDIFSMEAARIHEARVAMTVVGGKVAYSR